VGNHIIPVMKNHLFICPMDRLRSDSTDWPHSKRDVKPTLKVKKTSLNQTKNVIWLMNDTAHWRPVSCKPARAGRLP